MDERLREIVVVIIEQLKAYVDGNEDALVELTDVLDSGRFDGDEVGRAFEMIFRVLEPYAREDYTPEIEAKRAIVRVPTGPERALLMTNPAYRVLFGFLESSRITPEQFEEILARAKDMGASFQTEDQARELATEVLIRWFDDEHGVGFDPSPSAGAH